MLRKEIFITVLMILAIGFAAVAQETTAEVYSRWDDVDLTHVINEATGAVTISNKRTGESVVFQKGQLPVRFQKLVNGSKGVVNANASQTRPMADGMVLEALPKPTPSPDSVTSRKPAPGARRGTVTVLDQDLTTVVAKPGGELGDTATHEVKKPSGQRGTTTKRKAGTSGTTRSSRKKKTKPSTTTRPKPAVSNALPEVGDEVIVSAKGQTQTITGAHDKYANQETNYRKSKAGSSAASGGSTPTTSQKDSYSIKLENVLVSSVKGPGTSTTRKPAKKRVRNTTAKTQPR
jgi:hypothetical protein